jgi:hypothetical protein
MRHNKTADIPKCQVQIYGEALKTIGAVLRIRSQTEAIVYKHLFCENNSVLQFNFLH